MSEEKEPYGGLTGVSPECILNEVADTVYTRVGDEDLPSRFHKCSDGLNRPLLACYVRVQRSYNGVGIKRIVKGRWLRVGDYCPVCGFRRQKSNLPDNVKPPPDKPKKRKSRYQGFDGPL